MSKKNVSISVRLDTLFAHYWRTLIGMGSEPIAEYCFDRELGRRHRFDFAFVAQKLAVEIDGGQWQAHGGRHGRDSDREKMNIAAMLGWRVMHYSPQMLEADPEKCINEVLSALNFNQHSCRISSCNTT